MLGFIIVIAVSAAAGYFSYNEWGLGWSIGCTVLALILSWAVLALLLRRALSGKQMEVQNIMMTAQEKVNRQLELFNRRPPSSMNAAREMLEKIQFPAIRQALEKLEEFKKFYIWNSMLPKQINAMKVQLYYQLREYKKVDELLPNALMLDPQGLGIQMARMYKNENPALDKFYKRKCWRFRGENAAFVACVYGWIKVKQGEPEKALEALKKARVTSDNQVLTANIDALLNGREKHYSNSGLGDPWYVLALEEPKAQKIKKQQRGLRPF